MNCDNSKETEVEIKSLYMKLVGKLNDNINGDSDNNNTADSDGDDLEDCDIFFGGFQSSQVTNIIEV